MEFWKVSGLFVLTAIAEMLGCYLPWLVLKQDRSAWLLLPAAVSLGLFAWLLSLHPTASGRTYAAYGGVYIGVALIWLRLVDGVTLTRWDMVGGAMAFVGMAVIMFQPDAAH
ncbi:MAG: YnfA family protein [Aquabacterium sp.]|nr:MAG: YnfA family protein [Aquabacterium sp.]